MKPKVCTYGDARNEVLVSYLYDDIAAEERARFEQHLNGCALCRSELDELAGLRTHLGRWSVPEPEVRHTSVAALPASRAALVATAWKRARLGSVGNHLAPWARVAAAALFVGVALGAANLRVSYSAEGMSVRTGWMETTARDRSGRTDESSAEGSAGAAWRADLAELEQQLRAEIRDQSVQIQQAKGTVSRDDDEVVRRVRMLVQDSERRQQRELALRVAEVARDMQAQRQADLVNIDRSLGIIQSRTGMEVLRQQQLLNNLLRVSQKQ
jgi:hypothetical protein